MEEKSTNVFGIILIFGFVSVVMTFVSVVFFAALNNYALGGLYDLTNTLVASGIIQSSFSSVVDLALSNTPDILQVLDYIWIGGFMMMIAGTLHYSYNLPRKNYFNIFTMSIIGLVIFLWIGSYTTLVTEWFVSEIYYAVLPTISSYTPFLNWYLNDINLINLILVTINIIANFVDLDFSKYNKRKDTESIDEI